MYIIMNFKSISSIPWMVGPLWTASMPKTHCEPWVEFMGSKTAAESPATKRFHLDIGEQLLILSLSSITTFVVYFYHNA
jgi:hypothetical protein